MSTNTPALQLLGRMLRVDHVNDYKAPKDSDKIDEETRKLYVEGCAPKPQIPPELIKRETTKVNIKPETDPEGFRLPERLPIREIKKEPNSPKKRKVKKEKKAKKKKSKKSKKSRRHSTDSSSSSSSGSD